MGTYADAMAAGQRRRLAKDGLAEMCRRYPHDKMWIAGAFTLVVDRIEPQTGSWSDIAVDQGNIADCMRDAGFDVWREGTGLVVLGRLSA